MIITICGFCGKSFEAYKKNQKFCSTACGNAGKSRRQKEERIERICEVCRGRFLAYPSRRYSKYCSRTCWNKRGTILATCRECQSPFFAHRSSNSIFCSRNCYSLWQAKYVRGDAHPSWKGGSSHYRRGLDWKEQAEAARKRDNYTCQRCGIKQSDLIGKRKRLDVHHIIPWSISKSNALENLITVCRKCHIFLEPRPAEVRAILAQREPAYCQDIRQRLALYLDAGPIRFA
jgi:5-methylcytosine-specific restriction endonuclease McrA